MGGGRLETSPMGEFLSVSARISLTRSLSQEQDVLIAKEDHQAQFYKDYRKVAEEYDKEFMKEYNEDLNTTLIFVSSPSRSDGPVLMKASGRSVLRRRIRVHHSGPVSTSARSQRRDPRAPPDPDIQYEQHCIGE